METRNKYRFTLQWGAETAEKIQAGELLRGLGSRKSEFIVAAISEYVRTHPETLTSGPSSRIDVEQGAIEPSLTRSQVEAIVRDMIDARLANFTPVFHEKSNSENIDTASKDDIDAMIQNLDLFML